MKPILVGVILRIIYLSKGITSPVPGPQSVARNILDQLMTTASEFEFFILTDKRQSDEFEGEISFYMNKNFPIPEFPLFSFEWENFLSTRALNKICVKIKPDLLHIHGQAGYLPSPQKKYCSLVTFHDYPPMFVHDDFSFGPSKFLLSLWLKRGQMIRLRKLHHYNYFHTLSTEISRFLLTSGIPRSNIYFIPNAAPNNLKIISNDYFRKIIRKKLGIPADSRILTMVGTISYHKGIHLMKKCLPSLPDNFHLVLLGKSPKLIGYQYTKTILRGNEVQRIHYLGYQSRDILNAILQASDCFLSLSYSEACQLSPLEAKSMEIPAIVTDCGASRDIFGSNYDYLLPINPSLTLLKDKIMEAVEIGSKYDHNHNYTNSWKNVADSMKKAYIDIITKESRDTIDKIARMNNAQPSSLLT